MTHRIRFVELANRQTGSVSLLRSPEKNSDYLGETQEWDLATLNAHYMDVGFSRVIQCAAEVCEEIKQNYSIRKPVYSDVAKTYKYIMDVSPVPVSALPVGADSIILRWTGMVALTCSHSRID